MRSPAGCPDRLRAAAEAAAAGARFFELSRELLATANLDGYLVALNGSWEETLGWSPQELMARPFVEFVHPDDRARTEQEAARLGQDGVSTVSFTNRYRTKDGGWRWIEWSSNLDAEHGVVYTAARDVSDRRAAERAQREPSSASVARSRTPRSAWRSSGWTAAEANLVIGANEALARLCGYPARRELVGVRTLPEFVHPDDASHGGGRELAPVSTTVKPLSAGARCAHRRRGREIWVDFTTSLITDDNSAPLYRIARLQDIDATPQARQGSTPPRRPRSAQRRVCNRRRFEQESSASLPCTSAWAVAAPS